MQYERAKYEYPIPDISRRARSDAPAGVYLLEGEWHLAAHDSTAEQALLDAGGLLIATLSFRPSAFAKDIVRVGAASYLELLQSTTS